MEKCCSPDCDQTVSHSFGFPGEPVRFICDEHRAGRDAIASPDFLRVARFTPIEHYVANAPRETLLCTHKAHNSRHTQPAVLAYEWPGEPHERGPGLEPGVACAACIIELVRTAQNMKWHLELTELP